MAGAGYKLFSTGEVLTANNVNSYLMQQSVMVFATAAARTTALSGVVAEGMVSYRTDSKVLEVYNGTSWVDFTGDITGITTAANSGLSGGGTSGTITLTLATTAKGDLLIGTGSGTAAVLPVGTTNQTIIVDSTTTTGLKYASSAQSLLTAKADILTATAANTPARLGVGADTSILVADSTQSTGLAWALGNPISLNAQTGTSYTFVLTDNYKLVTASNASAQTYTIPPNSSVAYPTGSVINIIQIGAGQVSFAQGSGVTIASTGATSSAPKLRAQYSAASAVKVGTDSWYIVGDIS